MGYDSRFPHMLPLDRPIPGLSETDRKAARAAADAVCRRTGVMAAYDTRRGSLYFYWREMDSGVLTAPFIQRGGNAKRLGGHDVDRMVEYIQLGTVPKRVKDRWAESQRKMDEHDRQEAIGRDFEERRPDALDHARYLRQRRGMSSRWRKSAVVQGLGGSK